MKIIQLDTHLANLIAAGEVVERPASVAKELVENAIDAGARSVAVEIQNGGMTLLRVQDDGCGMEREDAKLAFLRHATSKLRRKEDLEAIGTLGFRGEALAATAAVSRIDLLTRTADAPFGTRLRLEGGKLLECEDAGCPVGTTILVRDLFFNTPARMKFMKRDAVEASAVFAAVQKQALAHPEVSFRFLKDGETVLQTPGDGDLASAVYSVLGRQTARELVPVESGWEKLKLLGFVSKPTATRGTRSYEMFFVNGRFVQSKTLIAALEEAYRGQIMVGRFPACVLNLTLPLSAVDVNVHPAKTEIKFLNEKDVFDCVHYGVKGALRKVPGGVELAFGQATGNGQQATGDAGAAIGRHPVPSEAPAGADAPGGPPETHRPTSNPSFFKTMTPEEYKRFSKVLESAPLTRPSQALLREVAKQPTIREEVRLPQPEPPAPAPKPAPAPEPKQEAVPLETPAFRVIGETLRTYILVEQGEDLILIDKHAAHERIRFERLLAQGTQILGQTLLTPLRLRLDREESAVLLENKPLLASLGYDFDDLGEGDLLLRQLPSDVPASEAGASLSEIASHLQTGRRDTPARLREELLHSIACKGAIKAGDRSDPLELEKLAAEVLSRDELKYCPHGRPICAILTRHTLEKQFKRIQ